MNAAARSIELTISTKNYTGMWQLKLPKKHYRIRVSCRELSINSTFKLPYNNLPLTDRNLLLGLRLPKPLQLLSSRGDCHQGSLDIPPQSTASFRELSSLTVRSRLLNENCEAVQFAKKAISPQYHQTGEGAPLSSSS